MCLDELTVKRILKKDMVVKKVIKGYVTENTLYTDVELSDKRIHEAERLNSMSVKTIKGYEPGFHCYLNNISDRVLKNHYLYEYYITIGSYRKIMTYIIPAGTKVQYGYMVNMSGGISIKVIVTPVLINPRVKE